MKTRVKHKNNSSESRPEKILNHISQWLFFMFSFIAIIPIYTISLAITFWRYDSVWFTIIIAILEWFFIYKIISYIIKKWSLLEEFSIFLDKKNSLSQKEKEKLIWIIGFSILSLVIILTYPVTFMLCVSLLSWIAFYFDLTRKKLYRIKRIKSYHTYSSREILEIQNHNNYYKNKAFKKYAQKKIFRDKHYLAYISWMTLLAITYIGFVVCVAFLMDKNIIPENMYTVIWLWLWLPISILVYRIMFHKQNIGTIKEYLFENLPNSTLSYKKLHIWVDNSYIFFHRR